MDSQYSIMFSDQSSWRDLVESGESSAHEIRNRVTQYLYNASSQISLPIAEAMLTLKTEKG